jgi:hypothetical protein
MEIRPDPWEVLALTPILFLATTEMRWESKLRVRLLVYLLPNAKRQSDPHVWEAGPADVGRAHWLQRSKVLAWGLAHA